MLTEQPSCHLLKWYVQSSRKFVGVSGILAALCTCEINRTILPEDGQQPHATGKSVLNSRGLLQGESNGLRKHPLSCKGTTFCICLKKIRFQMNIHLKCIIGSSSKYVLSHRITFSPSTIPSTATLNAYGVLVDGGKQCGKNSWSWLLV
jgi:hypothetical protein